MFNRTRRSVLAEIEKENPGLADILKSVNELLRMARGKLTYMQKVLQYYNRGAHINPDKAKEFLALNLEVLTRVEKLLEKESKLESNEMIFRLVFTREIENVGKAREMLQKLRHILEKENGLLALYINFWKMSDEAQRLHTYKKIAAMAQFVQREVELLGIESQKVQTVSDELRRLRERITNNRAMPLVKSQYYHGSYFIFNVGDEVRPSTPRTDVEAGKLKVREMEIIFEEVRKREFPHRPTRLRAIYCDAHPWTAESYGIVYAVKVEGIVFKTDQDIINEAKKVWDNTKDRNEVEGWAREYWKGSHFPGIPEVIVNGKVTILGLADYFKRNDRVEIIVDGIRDDDGNQIPKGSKGIIDGYDKFSEELPFEVLIDGRKRSVSLPASTIRKIKK